MDSSKSKCGTNGLIAKQLAANSIPLTRILNTAASILLNYCTYVITIENSYQYVIIIIIIYKLILFGHNKVLMFVLLRLILKKDRAWTQLALLPKLVL